MGIGFSFVRVKVAYIFGFSFKYGSVCMCCYYCCLQLLPPTDYIYSSISYHVIIYDSSSWYFS